MIKGHQVQHTKKGNVLLVLHRESLTKPEGVNIAAWTSWWSHIPKLYRIEKPGPWWLHVWPKVKSRVNIALAKGQSEAALPESRVWIRIAEDISISIYSQEAAISYSKAVYKEGPFHPGCLTDHIRVPIEWWNTQVDDLTDELQKEARHLQ